MWSLLYNGHTIVLPNSDDFYTVITDTTKMFTTNVDLPITQDLINIFNIKGLLTKEDNMFFKKVELPATLQGFGVRIPCKISIESIKQKEGLLNLYLESKSTIGYSPTEIGQTFDDIWDNFHYPLIRNLEVPYFWGGLTAPKFYTDNSNYVENVNVATNLPYLSNSQLNTLLRQIGYSNINIPAFDIYPNQIYMSGKYKMRRVYAEGKISDMGYGGGIFYPGSWDIDNHKLYKGDYAGLSNDEVTYNFSIERVGDTYYHLKHILTNKININSGTRAIYIFFQPFMDNGGFVGISQRDVNINIKCDEDTHITTTINNTIVSDRTTQNYSYSYSYTATPSDLSTNYITIENISELAQTLEITFEADIHGDLPEGHDANVENKFWLQYFFDDTFDGIVRLEGDNADETYSSETGQTYAGATTTTKHFNSMGFDAMGHNDYNPNAGDAPDTTFTSFIPPTFLLNLTTSNNIPVWRSFYNNSPALMWVNTLDCFEGISIYDILSRMAESRNLHLNADVVSWSIEGTNDIVTTNIDQYILYDELVLDDTYANRKVSFVNQDTENADEVLLQNTIESIPAERITGVNSNSTGLFSVPVYGIIHYGENNANLFNNMKQYYQNDDHSYLATFNPKAKGFALIRRGASPYWNLDYQETIFPITTLPVGQIVNVHIMGYIPTRYVVFQTRTFRILEQELGADGVNNLKLLLYK